MKRLSCVSRDRLLALILAGEATFVHLNRTSNMFYDIMTQCDGKPPNIVAIPEAQWREAWGDLGCWVRKNEQTESVSIPFTEFNVVPTRWKP